MSYEATNQQVDEPKQGSVTKRVLAVIAELKENRTTERSPWVDEPDERAFLEAIQFVKAWKRDPTFMPDIGIADDGELNFFWDQSGIHVDLGFYGDGSYSYYARDQHGAHCECDDESPENGMTEELAKILCP